MVDRYWYGGVERISPEAPVPVVAVSENDERLGGAANVARSVTALGAQCGVLAVTGDDEGADILEDLLSRAGITHQLCRDPNITTTVKLRVISRHQQLIRIDFESKGTPGARKCLLDHYIDLLPAYDVVIISDYGKGGLGHIQEMIKLAKEHGKAVIIDPKGDDYSAYRYASLITPNRKEFEQVVGRFTDNDDLERRARDMVADLELEGLLVTRGEEGMSLIPASGDVIHKPARARDVFDVTGAGDTVIASIGAAYAAGAETIDAVRLANIAAGIVVAKLGAETASPDEILDALKREEQE
ncbi:MAG: D-glycero-beta-D-manno-heptose-7-phosphate kinase [Proteobacteria bacterium]|nr:D-glycero-beta-D-manno-heptose-7-phosphate kinase [Pseudomonadota bacterium]